MCKFIIYCDLTLPNRIMLLCVQYRCTYVALSSTPCLCMVGWQRMREIKLATRILVKKGKKTDLFPVCQQFQKSEQKRQSRNHPQSMNGAVSSHSALFMLMCVIYQYYRRKMSVIIIIQPQKSVLSILFQEFS